jgi:hypothetical protein
MMNNLNRGTFRLVRVVTRTRKLFVYKNAFHFELQIMPVEPHLVFHTKFIAYTLYDVHHFMENSTCKYSFLYSKIS